ncbi:MAG: hypothetical protein JO311_07025 [Candidatus Eremiobacteraeota bacterium]|nr:hypothetical protein [Candidatus Eremiobacteraeota bacterium]MBV9264488.1 hypothetical protein [Candidatus Eremiobacteraeota bacterium]
MSALANFLTRWKTLSKIVRFGASAAAALLAVAGIVAVLLAHPARAPLFAQPLHADQLAEVEERLADWNVAFTPNSENIIVDAGRRNDLLLRLSLAGVPHAHLASTAEAVGNIGVLTPEPVADAQARIGLAGDIEGSLRGIQGVEDARIILAPAQRGEFADGSDREASAGVRLRMRDGAALSAQAVAGIRAFVAASVPQLRRERVTIVDDRGIALDSSAGGGDGDAADLTRSLQSAFDGTFGEGAALVRVRAEYDPRQVFEHETRRTALGTQAIEQTRHSESYDGGGKRYRHLDEGQDRGSDTRDSAANAAPGALKRLSAAVFVDQSRSLDLAKIRELAAATIGYDRSRGDSLAVEAVDFHRTLVVRKDVWWLLYGTVVPAVPVVVLAMAIILAARFALPPIGALLQSMMERATLERTSKSVAGFAPARVRSLLEREPPHAAAAIISALPAATATAVLDLYPPAERDAIVGRMQRRTSPLVDDPEELLRRCG